MISETCLSFKDERESFHAVSVHYSNLKTFFRICYGFHEENSVLLNDSFISFQSWITMKVSLD